MPHSYPLARRGAADDKTTRSSCGRPQFLGPAAHEPNLSVVIVTLMLPREKHE